MLNLDLPGVVCRAEQRTTVTLDVLDLRTPQPPRPTPPPPVYRKDYGPKLEPGSGVAFPDRPGWYWFFGALAISHCSNTQWLTGVERGIYPGVTYSRGAGGLGTVLGGFFVECVDIPEEPELQVSIRVGNWVECPITADGGFGYISYNADVPSAEGTWRGGFEVIRQVDDAPE